jgi:hypothetical protein
MSKANHLLETSKDFFIKPPTPPPSSSTIIEPKSISSSPLQILPDFNTTDNAHQIDMVTRHVK